VIILVVTLIMTSRRDLTIFIKMSSGGVFFITIVMLFIVAVGVYSTTNTEYTYSKIEWEQHEASGDTGYLAYLALAQSTFPPLMGILGGGFYFHNISLPVIRNSRNPENNVRDILIGYFLVFLTYVLCGSLGYYGFIGSTFEDQ
jgi:hypothetical protein